MKLAIISDIHGNLIAFNEIIKDINNQQVDDIIFLGDLVMNGPQPVEVFEAIKEIQPVVWIRGNTDNWLKEVDESFVPKSKREEYLYSLYSYAQQRLSKSQIDYLLNYPEEQIISVGGYTFHCVHGSNKSANEPIGVMRSIDDFNNIVKDVEADFLLCGHTHMPFISSYKGLNILNPGGVGFSLDADPRASYGLVEIDDTNYNISIRRLTYDVEKAIDISVKNKFPNIEIYERRLIKGEYIEL